MKTQRLEIAISKLRKGGGKVNEVNHTSRERRKVKDE